jgi:peptidoglycan hydrolase-like protein with peptidoglycan-binding domain
MHGSRVTNYIITMLRKIIRGSVLVFIGVITVAIAPQAADAESKCTFTRNLEVGTVGEDVRCLQKYLNSEGFVIAEEGVGSPGNETNLFREKTKEAVIRWQTAQGIYPATGYFGEKSRSRFGSPVSTPGSQPATPPVTPPIVVVPEPQVSLADKNALQAIVSARLAIEQALSDIKNAEKKDKNTEDAMDDIENAKAKMLLALYDYLDKKYATVIGHATAATEYARDARGSVKTSKKKNGLTYAGAVVFTNETIVKVRFDGKEYVFSTKEDDEDDIVEEIMDEVDNDDLSQDDVEDMLTVKEEDRESTDDDEEFSEDDDKNAAQDAIEDAEDLIDDAEDDIEDANDDGARVAEAEDLIDDAKNLLDDAEDAYDDEDYDEVIDLVKEIKDKVEDALDAIED